MVGINRFDGKDKRRQRLRNHIARDLRTPKYGQRIMSGRKRRFIDNENDGVFYEDSYYDDKPGYDE